VTRTTVLSVLATAGVALALTAAAAPASTAPRPQRPACEQSSADLKRYLAAVLPVATRIDRERRRALEAARDHEATGAGDAAALLRQARRRLFAAETAAARVRPPVELRGPHSALGQASRLAVSAAGRLAAQVEYGKADATALGNFRRSFARMLELELHFKDELTAQLRRVGIVVPLRLKDLARG
jgi:hypothetical protein